MLVPTLKETPMDAVVVSHQLMLRAGMIRKLAAGIYNYLPLGLRVIRKIENIIREEMNRAGAQELLMPTVLPAELWKESGRWDYYGPELLRFNDRKNGEFCFGPTHEEVITDIVRSSLSSYRELPINLYQIQTKFRDEMRPRFGLMRGREFIMKDAYSFHVNNECAHQMYWKMYKTYYRIFTRCGLKFRPVEADTGNIGGTLSHEFQVLAESGEDAILSCNCCDYTANVEKAETALQPGPSGEVELLQMEMVETPDKKSIEEVGGFLKVKQEQIIKALVYRTGEQLITVLIRGDRDLSEAKLTSFLKCDSLEMVTDQETISKAGLTMGFVGPMGLDMPIYADYEIKNMQNAVCGANREDYHYINVNLGRDFTLKEDSFLDLRFGQAGDLCPRCKDSKGVYQEFRGIEVGQVFFLGDKYSKSMKALYVDENGEQNPMIMGCYGIGVGRTGAAAIEQNHDKDGIIWPMPIAPMEVVIVGLNLNQEAVVQTCQQLYDQLMDKGVEVLFDDRDERPGVKFKDADLIGIPLRMTVSPRNLKKGEVEIKVRSSGEIIYEKVDKAVERLVELKEADLQEIAIKCNKE